MFSVELHILKVLRLLLPARPSRPVCAVMVEPAAATEAVTRASPASPGKSPKAALPAGTGGGSREGSPLPLSPASAVAGRSPSLRDASPTNSVRCEVQLGFHHNFDT